MGDDQGEKTEDATPRKRREAREKGQVAKSADVTAAAVLGTAAAVWWVWGLDAAAALAGLTAESLSSATPLVTESDARATLAAHAYTGGRHLAPGIILLACAAAAGLLGQFGVLLSPQAAAPKLSRVNPVSGFGRLFSARAVARLGGGVAKVVALAVAAGLVVWWFLPDLVGMAALAPTAEGAGLVLARTHKAVAVLAAALAAVLAALAGADYLFQRWQHERDLRMTKQQVRDELKSQDGDPQLKGRRREAHRKLAGARDLRHVADADVVLTNPTHYSVALKYNPDADPAPKVVAKGADELAFQIRALARKHGVPILERPALARRLWRDVEPGRPVPADTYAALVRVMAFVYKLKGKTPPKV